MSGRNDPPRFEYAAGEVSLPFSYLVQVSDAPRPAGLDFSHEPNPDNCQVFVRIEDELWQFRCPWIIGKPAIWRFAGPDIDHMERMDDGGYPEGLPLGWFLGGMWYGESDRKLYAPMHVEMEGFLREHPVARWNARKIALATSADKGKTWRYEGDILTPSTYYYNHDTYKFSGDCYSNGLADFGFYADVRSGYFYLFSEEAWISKGKFWGWWNTRVARCAMKDKMAPGAWRYFYNGTWDEPALGGKSSTVAPSHFWGIIYSTYLQRYISLFTSNGASSGMVEQHGRLRQVEKQMRCMRFSMSVPPLELPSASVGRFCVQPMLGRRGQASQAERRRPCTGFSSRIPQPEPRSGEMERYDARQTVAPCGQASRAGHPTCSFKFASSAATRDLRWGQMGRSFGRQMVELLG